MPIESIAKLETTIHQTQGLNAAQKTQLLALLADLKHEIEALAPTHAEHAHSIANFTDISAHEATRQHKNQHLLRIAIEGLSTSVEEFEASHPQLVNTVNKISDLLASLGI
jgi:uncharacterized protein DUF4404